MYWASSTPATRAHTLALTLATAASSMDAASCAYQFKRRGRWVARASDALALKPTGTPPPAPPRPAPPHPSPAAPEPRPSHASGESPTLGRRGRSLVWGAWLRPRQRREADFLRTGVQVCLRTENRNRINYVSPLTRSRQWFAPAPPSRNLIPTIRKNSPSSALRRHSGLQPPEGIGTQRSDLRRSVRCKVL